MAYGGGVCGIGARAVGAAMFSKGKPVPVCFLCLTQPAEVTSWTPTQRVYIRNMAATSLVGICRRASAFLKAACSLVNPKDPAHSG